MRTYRFARMLWQRRRLTFYVPAKAFWENVHWNVRAAWLNTGPPPPPLELTEEEWMAWEEAYDRASRA